MSHPYPHQDWKEVVLYKPTPKKENNGGGGPKPPQEGDEFKLPKVGQNLKIAIMQARIVKKWSQKELANRCGVGEDLIKKYESGKIVPNNNFVVKMERVLGVSLPRITKKKV
jgi:ribosome-binding protein aMBF1 (putative translation factor)|tara:strand:+ start:2547 stop:2882 length:336 start_codon:yes stop_codon:yes gene_type:complete